MDSLRVDEGVMVTVDVRGIREVQEEFELIPRETERALQAAVRRTIRETDTLIRRQVRDEVGFDVRGSRIRVRSGQRSAVRGQIWGGADTVPVDYLRGAVRETRGDDGKPAFFVYGRYVYGAFRARRGPIGGRGRLRRRLPDGRSELVKVSIVEAVARAFAAGGRNVADVLVRNFTDEAGKIVRRTRT